MTKSAHIERYRPKYHKRWKNFPCIEGVLLFAPIISAFFIHFQFYDVGIKSEYEIVSGYTIHTLYSIHRDYIEVYLAE